MKYLKTLPFILFPYLWILYIFLVDSDSASIVKSILFYTIVGGYLLSSLAYNVSAIRGTFTASQAAWVNLWVRVALIPIYVCIFIFACMGLALGPFALGAIAMAFVVDVVMIIVTAFTTMGCNIALAKGKVFPKGLCVFFWFLNCIFCVDVVMAIVYVVAAKRAEKR